MRMSTKKAIVAAFAMVAPVLIILSLGGIQPHETEVELDQRSPVGSSSTTTVPPPPTPAPTTVIISSSSPLPEAATVSTTTTLEATVVKDTLPPFTPPPPTAMPTRVTLRSTLPPTTTPVATTVAGAGPTTTPVATTVLIGAGPTTTPVATTVLVGAGPTTTPVATTIVGAGPTTPVVGAGPTTTPAATTVVITPTFVSPPVPSAAALQHETTTSLVPTTENPNAYLFTSIIPRVRHTISNTNNLPADAEAIDRRWRRNEPGFTHVVHDDEECLGLAHRFAAERLGDTPELRFLPPSQLRYINFKYKYNFSEVYENYQLNVMRADVCRALVIYFYGGFYMDLDVDHVKHPKDWGEPIKWDATDLLLGMEYGTPHRDITNFFFAATARHPYLRILLEHMNRIGQDPNPFMTRDRNTIHKHTGPTVWLYALKDCRVPREYLFTERAVYHAYGQTSQEVVGGKFFEVPQAQQHNYHNIKDSTNWFRPLPQMTREDLHGVMIKHQQSAPYAWLDLDGERTQKLALREGAAVQAIGRRARAPVSDYKERPVGPDEVHLSLTRKRRFVVWQDATSMAGDALAIYNDWFVKEQEMTHQIVSRSECEYLAYLSTGKRMSNVTDAYCGLLAVHHLGGGYYMHHSVRRAGSFFDWADAAWLSTDILLVNRSPTEMNTHFFGATAHHRCTGIALNSLAPKAANSSGVTPQEFSEALRECTVDDEYFHGDRRWVLYGINGYSMGVRVEFLKANGFPRSYAQEVNGNRLRPVFRPVEQIASILTF